jgi:hypothetical protein
MLKRTITLLGLTITVGALLLTIGCGGSNSNPVAPVSSDQPLVSRQVNELPTPSCLSVGKTRDGKLRFVVKATDPEGDKVFFKLIIWKDGQLFSEPNQKNGDPGWVTTYVSGNTTYAVYTTPQPVSSGIYKWQVGATDDKHDNPGEWSLSGTYSMGIF